MILKLTLDLPELPIYVRTVRLLSRCLLEDIKVTRSTINDVEDIVGELCTNVVRHAMSKATHYQLYIEYYQPMVVITVKDAGDGFIMADVLPAGSSRSDGEGGERFGGFGLSMVSGLSDKLDFIPTHPHGTTVRVEKTLQYESRDAAAQAKLLDIAGANAAAESMRDRIKLLSRS